MNFALTASELAFYATQGYLVRESEFNDNEVTDLQDAAECAATEALRLAAKGQTYTLDGRGFTDV